MQVARRLFYRRAASTPPTISEVVLGEVFLTIASDVLEGAIPLTIAADAGRRLVEAVREDRIRICGVGAHSGGDTVEIAAMLRREDNRLDFTDALVAATALTCDDCQVLYTNDPKILGCRPLLQPAEAKGLTVREAF